MKVVIDKYVNHNTNFAFLLSFYHFHVDNRLTYFPSYRLVLCHAVATYVSITGESSAVMCTQRVPADVSDRPTSPDSTVNVHLYYSPVCPVSESGVSAGLVMYMTLKLNVAGQSIDR